MRFSLLSVVGLLFLAPLPAGTDGQGGLWRAQAGSTAGVGQGGSQHGSGGGRYGPVDATRQHGGVTASLAGAGRVAPAGGHRSVC